MPSKPAADAASTKSANGTVASETLQSTSVGDQVACHLHIVPTSIRFVAM